MREKEVYQEAVMEILVFTAENRIFTDLTESSEKGDVGELGLNSMKSGMWSE